MDGHSDAFKDIRLFDLEPDTGCPIYVSAAQINPTDPARRRVASGWGETRDAARQKCLWEAKERACAVWRDAMVTQSAPLSDMIAHAPDPRDVILLSPRQYQERASWNGLVGPPHRHPAPFSPQQPVAWVEGRSLYGDALTYLPAGFVYLGYPRALSEGFPVPDSNGLAAGSDAADAASRALLELVERDAVSVWWYNQLNVPEAAGATTALTEAFASWLRRGKRKLCFLDLTTDLDVPVVAAVTCDHAGQDLSIGFGAGWSTAAAAESAVGELAQFDMTKRLSRTSGNVHHPLSFLSILHGLSRDAAQHLRPCRSRPATPARQTAPEALRDKLTSRGISPVVVNLFSGETAVARVVAPGLRPIWPRFAAGRLYDVPVALKAKTEKTQESALNPLPILY